MQEAHEAYPAFVPDQPLSSAGISTIKENLEILEDIIQPKFFSHSRGRVAIIEPDHHAIDRFLEEIKRILKGLQTIDDTLKTTPNSVPKELLSVLIRDHDIVAVSLFTSTISFRKEWHSYMKHDDRPPAEQVEENVAEAKKAVWSTNEAVREANKAKEEIRQHLATIIGAKKVAEAALGEIGSGINAKEFNELAENYKSSSQRWLRAGVGVVGFILYFLWSLWGNHTLTFLDFPLEIRWPLRIHTEETYGAASWPEAYQFTVYLAKRITVFSVAFWALARCVQNYRANRYNAVINRHKAAVLHTLNALTQSTNTPLVKETILMKVVDTVISIQQTGYLENEKESHSSQEKILETIEKMIQARNESAKNAALPTSIFNFKTSNPVS